MLHRPSRLVVIAWIVAVAALLVSITAAKAGTTGKLFRILELNFNSEVVAFDDRAGHMRDRRFAAMVEFIQREAPDVILLTEGWNYRRHASVAVALAEATGYNYHYRLVEGFPGLLYDSNVILAKKDHAMSNRHHFKLPHSAWSLGDELHTILPLGKRTVAVGARLQLPNGEPMYVYATHLLGNNAQERADQVVALNRAVQKRAALDGVDWRYANVLVGGDLNSDPDSFEMQFLRDNGYADTWAEAHPNHFNDTIAATSCSNPYSWHYNPINLGAGMLPRQDTIGREGRIDFIFARGPSLRVLASTVLFTHPYHGFWMSDHYGILTTLAVGNAPVAVPANPLTDSDGLPRSPTRVLEITEANFAACEKQIDCDLKIPTQDVEALRGIAVVNKSGDRIQLKITGPARPLPAPASTLEHTHASSFVFTQPGNYQLVVHNSVGDSLSSTLRVQ